MINRPLRSIFITYDKNKIIDWYLKKMIDKLVNIM